MKKFRLFVVMAMLALLSAPCFAEGLGYINYEKVLANFMLFVYCCFCSKVIHY